MDRDATLREVEQRVLWLATAIVHHANRVRPNPTGLKVGGHQASSASMVTIMTALWFEHLRPEDRVSVKPHASPVLHAINYLLGELDERLPDDAARVRRAAELPEPGQGPGPGRLLDRLGRHRRHRPDLGRAGPPLRRRTSAARAPGRQYSLVGDAELDEGACWEADPRPDGGRARRGRAGSSTSTGSRLDRVVPNIGATRLQGMFAAAGWQVLTVKYGRLLHELFDAPRRRRAARGASTRCPTPSTSACCAAPPTQLRERLPGTATPDARRAGRPGSTTTRCTPPIRNLGGHDLDALRRGVRRDRRHPPDRDLRLHGEGLRPGHARGTRRTTPRCSPTEQLRRARRAGRRRPPTQPWARFADGSRRRARCARETAERLRRDPVAAPPPAPRCPTDIGRTPAGTATTQAALGPRAARPHPRRRPRPRGASSRCARTSARRPTSAAG